MFFLLHRRTDGGICDNFSEISNHFLKISEDSPKLTRNIAEHYPKIFEDF